MSVNLLHNLKLVSALAFDQRLNPPQDSCKKYCFIFVHITYIVFANLELWINYIHYFHTLVYRWGCKGGMFEPAEIHCTPHPPQQLLMQAVFSHPCTTINTQQETSNATLSRD